MLIKRSPLVLLMFMLPVLSFAGPIDKVAELIRQGNSHELARYFATTLDMTVVESSNVYSSTQAELVLDKFFKENKPRSIKFLHRINSSASYNFAVLLLNTDKGLYRVAITMKEVEKEMSVVELRIEAEKK